MKSTASRSRTSTRIPAPARGATKRVQTGNGHTSGNGSAPAVSSALANWLAKPKHNLIGGKWVPAASGKTFKVVNPADASEIAQVPDSGAEDINQAVRAARKAFESGPWRRLTP